MTEKDIKPIPQTILKEIYKRDLKIDPWQTSIVRYYAYLAIWKKELVKVLNWLKVAIKIPRVAIQKPWKHGEKMPNNFMLKQWMRYA